MRVRLGLSPDQALHDDQRLARGGYAKRLRALVEGDAAACRRTGSLPTTPAPRNRHGEIGSGDVDGGRDPFRYNIHAFFSVCS